MATCRMAFSLLFAVGCGSITEPTSTPDAGTTAPPIADAAAGARDASAGPTSDAEVASLRTYLKSKYALSF
jgi:hypothetical protein